MNGTNILEEKILPEARRVQNIPSRHAQTSLGTFLLRRSLYFSLIREIPKAVFTK